MDELVFVGTGVSTGIPVIGHLAEDCACFHALKPGNKNRRNNVSLLIRRYREGLSSPSVRLPPSPQLRKNKTPSPSPAAEEKKKTPEEWLEEFNRERAEEEEGMLMGKIPAEGYHNILIDVGKTFRDAYFSTMAPLGVASLTSVLVTHDHADAMGGLDDLRDLQCFEVIGEMYRCEYHIPTYMSSTTLKTLSKQLGYVTSNSLLNGPHTPTAPNVEKTIERLQFKKRFINRRVTCLDITEISDTEVEPFTVQGMEEIPFYTIPLFHGGTYRCLGFAFGSGLEKKPEHKEEEAPQRAGLDIAVDGGSCVVYLSDVNELPKDSLAFLKQLQRIDVLVLDCLLGPYETHFSHFCLDQFWDLIVELQPKKTFAVGMYCDLEHEDTNCVLAVRVAKHKETNPSTLIETVELAYDGLTLPVQLS